MGKLYSYQNTINKYPPGLYYFLYHFYGKAVTEVLVYLGLFPGS